MAGPIQVFARSPGDCQATEIDDFMALVLAGGEVEKDGLEDRVQSAVALVFLTVDCCLCGVSALKIPKASYRKRLSKKSTIAIGEQEFPYELGWIYVVPSARGRRFSVDLTRVAVASAGPNGIFATSRTTNAAVHATLAKFDFISEGEPWASERGGHNLQLFLRHAQRPAIVETTKNA